MEEIRFESDCDVETTHFHSEMEILYVLTGCVAVMTANTNFVLNPEDFAVFNPYEQHGLYREKGTHTLSLYISPAALRYARLGTVRCASCTHPEQEEYLRMIRVKLAVLYKSCVLGSRDRLYILEQLFGLMAILQQEFADGEEEAPGKEPDNILKAIRYISEHYTENLTLQQTADHVFWSKSHFSREFQKYTGIPFADYVRTLRLNMASSLLVNSDRSVTEVAQESGFSNVNTMIHNFRQKYGCTPGEYRLQKEAEKNQKNGEQSSAEISFMGLLRHESFEDYYPSLPKTTGGHVRLRLSAANDGA